ncbi:MAG TPA: HAD family hydrolase [Thermoanaerobaculia bacterium]|nr:HAD family hydrolase [Thermoanaerobaculia bacterium]
MTPNHISPIAHHKSGVTALLFDFGGTLDGPGVAWRERFFRLWREEEEVPRERFDRAFFAADDALEGSVPLSLPFAETVGRLARGIAAGLRTGSESVPGRVAMRFCADSLESLSRSAALLQRLAPRYKLGVVSNFYGNLAAVCREVGLDGFLSAEVDSAVVGCRKPDRAIFDAAFAQISAGPADSVFIGDSLERDMAGARGVGMRHVLLAGEAPDGRWSCCPEDPVIRRLDELAEMFL